VNTPFDERVRRAADLVHSHFAEPLSVAALASAVGLSPSRFAHLFRQETGVSPARYVEEVRLERAQLLLLRTDMPIKQIAPLVGFEDPYYFSTRFRRRFGRPPTEWRRGPTFPALSPSTVSSTIVWR
jgi:AraC family transcriptional regulator of arabinose operon